MKKIAACSAKKMFLWRSYEDYKKPERALFISTVLLVWFMCIGLLGVYREHIYYMIHGIYWEAGSPYSNFEAFLLAFRGERLVLKTTESAVRELCVFLLGGMGICLSMLCGFFCAEVCHLVAKKLPIPR